MKKIFVALLAINFLWNGQSYAAEKNLDELLDEQREIVKILQSKKNDEQNKKLLEHIAELEKQIEELKNKKSEEENSSLDEVNKKISELNKQQEQLLKLSQLPATKVASLGSETPNCLDTADLLTAETISRGLLITKAI